MYKIAIIGAGQLGSRHLQGLLKINIPACIEVMDPNPESLFLAKQRAQEVAPNSQIESIKYFGSVMELSDTIDICIIATTANVRYLILEELTQSKKVKNLILEKVLFQRLSEYDLALNIIEKNNIKCWVNCPRRIIPVYNEIKSLIIPGERITYTVIGGEWGLACNSIHFIDHLNYLNGTDNFSYDVSGVYDIVEGKRKGNFEFLGSIYGKSDGTELFLHSRGGSAAPSKIQILTDKYAWEIDEANGTCITSSLLNDWKPVVTNFKFLYQSQLTNTVCEDIILKGETGLTDYSVSSKLHKGMLNAFIKLFNKNTTSNIDYCPIT